MTGRLLLVPTLLGATDIEAALPMATIHAARACRHFLVENAKSARAFLKTIGHPLPLQEIGIIEIGHHPADGAIDGWLAPARAGADVAIVSEAGCPGIADPGADIVARAHAVELQVVPLVGPSAPLLLLMAAGMDGQRFRFVGYLPQDAAACARAIRGLETRSRSAETQIFIETPYRNERLMSLLLEHLQPSTRLAIGVELTTPGEHIRSMDIERWRRLPAQRRPGLAKRPAVFAVLAPFQSGGRR